jgi:hypothetical protein
VRIVGGLPLGVPHSGKNSKCDNWTIDGSICDAFSVSPDTSFSQLVMARWRVLTVGLRGNCAGGILSDVFGRPHSIKARTVQSLFDVVANVMSNVLAEANVSGPYQVDFSNILLSEQIAACVIRSSEEVMLSNSVCVSYHFPLFWDHNTLNNPLVVTQTNADFAWFG